MKNYQSKGFTLVELIVVFAIFFIVTGFGMVQFNQFSTSQILDSSMQEMIVYLQTARTFAVSQTLLPPCSQDLIRYSVTISPPATYSLRVYCNGSGFNLNKTKKLPSGVTFDAGSSPEIFFQARSGFSTGGTINLKGSASTKKILINTAGNITAQ